MLAFLKLFRSHGAQNLGRFFAYLKRNLRSALFENSQASPV
jgi:hypothetical protein